ncbi:VOC family protein [Brevundimonas sp.]|jgi:glyoxylase I family protein|uniref:VOC family protein n=1 Tax=Brevundimonas sp. TaxID=1871086 RepID=UPI00262832DF|nr:VOC family protein [Brevundimonas sp.]
MTTLSSVCPLLQVFDMPTAVAFYRDGLGFEMVQTSGEIDAPEGRYFHWAWLRSGAVELMLNTAYDAGERPASPDPERVQAHSDTLFYFSCDDADAFAEAVKARGLEVLEIRTAPHGSREVHLRDPDGYSLCFQSRVTA